MFEDSLHMRSMFPRVQAHTMARRFVVFWHPHAGGRGKFWTVRLPRKASGPDPRARGVRARVLKTERARRPDLKFWVVVRMV